MDEDSEEVSGKYGWGFQEFKAEDFDKLYNLIKSYAKSKAVRKNSEFFLEYLMKCVAFEPEKCVDLMQDYANFEQPNLQVNALRGEEPVQILIGAYNKLTDDEYKEKVMDIFDEVLKNEAYKHEGLKVLAEEDRE